jgi:hypothetical protein
VRRAGILWRVFWSSYTSDRWAMTSADSRIGRRSCLADRSILVGKMSWRVLRRNHPGPRPCRISRSRIGVPAARAGHGAQAFRARDGPPARSPCSVSQRFSARLTGQTALGAASSQVPNGGRRPIAHIQLFPGACSVDTSISPARVRSARCSASVRYAARSIPMTRA